MAARSGDSDSFTRVVYGHGGSGVNDAVTERFGWDAPPPPTVGYPAVRPLAVHPTPLEERPVGVEQPETVVLRVRPHGRRLVLPVLVLFATVTAYGWFGGRLPEEWQNWGILIAAGALVFFCTLLPLFAWLGHRYTVTTRRIIARTGLFTRVRRDVWLSHITDVRLRRTPGQALAGSGTVWVTAGPDLTVALRDVPSAKLVAAALDELRH